MILRDRLLTVPYTAELRDGALVDITQTDTAENDTASPRFDDNFDAYQWLYTGELSTWSTSPSIHSAMIPTYQRCSNCEAETDGSKRRN